MSEERIKRNIVVLGDPGTGKTSIIECYMSNVCMYGEALPITKPQSREKEEKLTIGKTKEVKRCKLNTSLLPGDHDFWETVDEKKFGKNHGSNLERAKNLVQESHGAVIICNLADKKTAENIKYWIGILSENNPERIEHIKNCAELHEGDMKIFNRYKGKLYPVVIIANKEQGKPDKYKPRDLKQDLEVIKELKLDKRIFTTDVKKTHTMKPPFLYLVRQFFGGLTIDQLEL